ncbi:MAG TPA: hypothetical protein VK105_20350 [Virgibacillus sp.]|nr:hypothetical protein [Virgibacillus sp.]HLR69445.1 hypothetical protein [Virgibacillus sp.]
MANWATGTLKLRGTKEDIKRFLTEGLEAIQPAGRQIAEIMRSVGKEVKFPDEVDLNYKEDEWDLQISSKKGIYIKGTRRSFIDSDIEWNHSDYDSEIQTLHIDGFNQAWGVDVVSFAKISEKYNLDIKIYVFEQGMEFNQDIEIHKGEIVRNKEIEFDDYQWECLHPNWGG